MATIEKIVEDHKSKMKRGIPQLNVCDRAVMVWWVRLIAVYAQWRSSLARHRN
jgi:hypothetical protein